MRWIGVLLTLLLALPAQSQHWATHAVCDVKEPRIYPEVFAPASPDQLGHHIRDLSNNTGKYWRITARDGAVSYLWGTMHSNDPIILELPRQVEDDIKRSRVIALEIDFTTASRVELEQRALGEDVFLDSPAMPPFLQINLPQDTRNWIRQRTQSMGWGADAVEYMKLSALVELILFDPCEDFAAGTYPIQDGRIQMLGAISGATLLGLEDPSAVRNKLNAPENRDLAEAILAIYGAYLAPGLTPEARATSFALYLEGRIGMMMAWERQYMLALYGNQQGQAWLSLTNGYLVNERNHTFLARALPELEKGGVFMAIGNFHLPGEQGMVALLRKAGFAVERLPLPNEAP